jgi:hypothetical protein
MPQQATKKMTKYLITTNDRSDDVVIEIPAAWRLTFATVNPASGKSYSEGYAVRVYEGTKLRAVFDNVRSFRDLAIPLVRKVRSEVGNSSWSRDSVGNFSETTDHKVQFELVEETEDRF